MKKLFVFALFVAGASSLLAQDNGESEKPVDEHTCCGQHANNKGAKPSEKANSSQDESKAKSEDEPFDFSALLGEDNGDE